MIIKSQAVLALCVIAVTGCSIAPINPPVLDSNQPPKAVVLSRYPSGDYERFAALYKVSSSHFGISYFNNSHEATARLGAVAGIITILSAESESKRIGESIGDITSINLTDLLKETDQDTKIAAKAQPGEYALIPSARLLFRSATRFDYSCQITAEYDTGGSEQIGRASCRERV